VVCTCLLSRSSTFIGFVSRNMTLISFLGWKKKQSSVSEKWIVTMATYYEEGSRTKDNKGKNRDRNEKFGEQLGPTIARVKKNSLFCLKPSRDFLFVCCS